MDNANPIIPITTPSVNELLIPISLPMSVVIRLIPAPRIIALKEPNTYAKIKAGFFALLSNFLRASSSVYSFSVYWVLILLTMKFFHCRS